MGMTKVELTERLTKLTERKNLQKAWWGMQAGDEQGGCCSLQWAGKKEVAETGE